MASHGLYSIETRLKALTVLLKPRRDKELMQDGQTLALKSGSIHILVKYTHIKIRLHAAKGLHRPLRGKQGKLTKNQVTKYMIC